MSSLNDLLNQGASAYYGGLSKSKNPYSHGTAAYWNWLEGYEQAESEDNYENECGWE